MRVTTALAALGALTAPIASAGFIPGADKDGMYWIKSDSIRAAFIPYGAVLAKFLVNDLYGVQRDIIFGFENERQQGCT